MAHREDGPAAEYHDGSKHWFLNDKEYSKEEWEEKLRKDTFSNKIVEVEGKKTNLFPLIKKLITLKNKDN